ncbi:hypothetical protein [Endozoicomonas atrinae]|uniref:hypothetical protein n=1 Tax=Endozoicomonas atrinae TaxID=1333660 RepID=UPI000826F150|nr:hypothetical protein [Endozoicomonas atrinae]
MKLKKWLERLPEDLQLVVAEKSRDSLLTLVNDLPMGKGWSRFTRTVVAITNGFQVATWW